MNIESLPMADKSFALKLVNAIGDPNGWGAVLEAIMEMTGAKGAIITLRDKHTCQIVNDVEIEQKYHSPLVRGFATEQIVHYLTNLRTIDPWAEFQRSYYPHRPVQMSRVCPRDSVPDRRFFDWLETVGFRDTIVFELDRMAGYWTALNLFLEHPTGHDARTAMAFANEYCDLLRNAWTTSQSLSKTRQAQSALLQKADSVGAAVCIVGANGEFVEGNALFDAVLDTRACRLSGTGRKVSFSNSARVIGLDRWEQHPFLRHDAGEEQVVIMANPISPDPLFAGKRETLWMLTVTSAVSGQAADTSKDLSALTRQERDLYLQVAAGKSVSDAGLAIGLKRSRSFDVWHSVKSKLGIRTAYDLRT